MPDFFTTPDGRRLAYEYVAGSGPGIVFLGGLKSDMLGSKAQYLFEWAKRENRSYLRFDYSGHGQSDGQFADGSIGDWTKDAEHVIRQMTQGAQILVGSSMGGWIALLLAARFGDLIAGLVGIATAADFTEDSFWDGFSAAQKKELEENGHLYLPSEYDEPYLVTQKLITDGRMHLVLRSPLHLPCPTRFLQGEADTVVPPELALKLLRHITGPDIQLNTVKGADHSFSTQSCLALISQSIRDMSSSIAADDQ